MTNQEQYEKMIIPNELYTIDHNKTALNAAKILKEHCLKHNTCLACNLYSSKEGCKIYRITPAYWEV